MSRGVVHVSAIVAALLAELGAGAELVDVVDAPTPAQLRAELVAIAAELPELAPRCARPPMRRELAPAIRARLRRPPTYNRAAQLRRRSRGMR